MNKQLENRIVLYSVAVIALLVNLPKLALIFEGSLARRFVSFDLWEFLYLVCITALFGLACFRMNLHWLPSLRRDGTERFRPYIWQNLLLLLVCCITAIQLHKWLFHPPIAINFVRGAYFLRFSICVLLEVLIVRIIYQIRETRRHEAEKEQVMRRSAETELELMKQQLNPHFFFNALSTLSGLTREDPAKAQDYIAHLSRVFRNLLQASQPMVTVGEELRQLSSYTALLKMRFEEGICISVDVPPEFATRMVPHFCLQPLVENAAKHNLATPAQPLRIDIYTAGADLVVANNLQPVRGMTASSGLGLHNLHERFRILMGRAVTVSMTNDQFIVKLPTA
ncbi:sensor histidine kinase [Chitinophaga cymbidii]|uniref:Signal transduction histidine kinase internal region domain-containing protein n=1 Tax=Chitinophaga cymbidii TaxID=1096750 RepID=A0A512RLS0_9BACT|nr:histidine kinase [Chitinophaga cymbidii]GEP96654.1 hypothetical protein CCY01nite_29140 [Chitinophaga cymbidii]